MERDATESGFEIVEIKRRAQRYYERLEQTKRENIDAAFAKIRENPYRDEEPLAIRKLKGRLRGLWEYRGVYSLRIIYQILDKVLRQIVVITICPHL